MRGATRAAGVAGVHLGGHRRRPRTDHLLNLFTQPALEGDTARFVASCEAPEGCGRTQVMTAVDGDAHEELGRTEFELAPAGKGAAQQIVVDLSADAATRLRDGVRVMVGVEPHPDSEVHPHQWGYRAFMRGG